MKKTKFLSFLAAFALIFAACSNVDGPDGPGDDPAGDNKTVADMLAMSLPAKDTGTETFTVEAYIVGSYNFNHDPKFVIGAENADVNNVLIADAAESTDTYKVMAIKLGDYKAALNLVDNPDNYKKKVVLTGTFEKYCGVAGLVNLTKVILDGKEITVEGSGGSTEIPADAIFSESFATGQGDFTIVDVVKPAELDYVWRHNATYKQMAAGAYKDDTNHATESWLISPAIDLSKVSKATFSFAHAGKQFDAPVTNLTIQVSTTYTSGDIKAEDWKEIAIPNHLAGETNTFKSAGNMDLTSYCGQSNVRIAFKYTSTTTGAGNWYVQNVYVK